MSGETSVLSVGDLKRRFGTWYSRREPLRLRNERIPKALWPLAHYAALWGIPDDSDRESLVRAAPRAALENLVAVVDEYSAALDEWLTGPESYASSPSDEYVAFSAMRMIADWAE